MTASSSDNKMAAMSLLAEVEGLRDKLERTVNEHSTQLEAIEGEDSVYQLACCDDSSLPPSSFPFSR